MKNNHDNVDMLLRRTLSITETPDPELVQRVKYNIIKEEYVLNKSTVRRSFGTVAAAVTAFVLITTTALAAWYFLKPSEVADKFEDSALSAAFESEGAVNINESVTSGDYIITLLAIVSGKDITVHPAYSNGEVLSDRTYAVTAIQKADGSPMPATMDDDYGNPPFYVSPYVKGLKPWQVNAHTMNGGYSEMVIDGVMYRMLECDGIMMFADRGVYIGISTSSSYDSQAFSFNEQTGELKANPDYDGSSVVFKLPLDEKYADSERAEQYLKSLEAPSGDNENSNSDIAEYEIEDIWDNAIAVDSTVRELTVGANGEINYTYDCEYGSGTVIAMFDDCFGDSETERSKIVAIMQDDNSMYAVRFSMDDQGVITGAIVILE